MGYCAGWGGRQRRGSRPLALGLFAMATIAMMLGGDRPHGCAGGLVAADRVKPRDDRFFERGSEVIKMTSKKDWKALEESNFAWVSKNDEFWY